MVASPAKIARGLARQEEARKRALDMAADWPGGMPPLLTMGVGMGTLVGLEKRGLMRRLPERDSLGELRFVLTDEGRAAQ